MKIGRKTEFILYTLGKIYSTYNKRLKLKFLEIAVSKKIFIDLIKKASITMLSERTLYRHLELMEKNKLIIYNSKKIKFTLKGKNNFKKIRDRFEDYYRLGEIISHTDISKLCSKSQTIFSRETVKKSRKK